MNVTISIPCRNEEKYIARCLQSIVNSDYPQDKLFVAVCDGMSTDKTRNIIADFENKYPFIKRVDNLMQTAPFALNLGINCREFDIAIILGAHAEIAPDYVSKCVDTFSIDNSIGCVGGILNSVSEDDTTSTIAAAMSSSFGVGNAHFRTGNKVGYVDTVAFGAYKKNVFDKCGYFDEDLTRNQDDEFNYRILKSGFKIYLNPEIKSTYYVRSSFSKLFHQYFQYGYWKVFVNKKHNSITTIRQLVPACFVLFLFMGIIASFFSIYISIVYIAVLFVYLFTALFAALSNILSKRKPFATVWTFLILHISYGLGYIEGLLNFIILNRKPNSRKSKLTR
jgi:glycosyltransferase involved in cell wall biosynthesis